MQIGFVGMGNLGSPMASRLIQAGFFITLWDHDPERMTPFQGSGATFAAGVGDLGSRCEQAHICVFNDQDVEETCTILIPAMRPGGVIIIHSTVHPALCVALAGQAEARGLSLIDAPVSGGAPGATAGTLAVMVGGDAAVLERVRPALEAFGRLISHVGPVGAGQNAKIINNAVLAANMGVAHHAMIAADALGLDRKALAEIIMVSTGRSRGLEVYADHAHPLDFALGANALVKDLRLLGETLGRSAEFTALNDMARPYLDAVTAHAEREAATR